MGAKKRALATAPECFVNDYGSDEKAGLDDGARDSAHFVRLPSNIRIGRNNASPSRIFDRSPTRLRRIEEANPFTAFLSVIRRREL